MPYERERERETQHRPLRDLWRRPIVMVCADYLKRGDIIHECDNPDLRGVVHSVRRRMWDDAIVVEVQTTEDFSSRRIDFNSMVLITKMATERKEGVGNGRTKLKKEN